MAALQQKAKTMLWYAKFKSIVCVKYEFKYEYGLRQPDMKRIRMWYKHCGIKTFPEATADLMQKLMAVSRLLLLGPNNSIPQASADLRMPQNYSEQPVPKTI
jgi:hypothetical protein